MKRRDFITLVGGVAAAWPVVTQAQQMLPVIGWVSGVSTGREGASSFAGGLSEGGYFDGRNVAIQHRHAEGQYDRLPSLLADLIERKVTVIFASDTAAAVKAKAATNTIPIVFRMAADPVAAGLVTSLNRPGGNITGITTLNLEVGPKRLELLHELVPTATIVAALINPDVPGTAETLSRDLQRAAQSRGLTLHVLYASTDDQIDAAFAALVQLRAAGLVIGTDGFFVARGEKLAALALRHRVPAIFQWRDFVAAGGLMSYGGSYTDAYRLAGIYTGRVLKGVKPAELAIQQATKVELFVNLKTAKALGLIVPPSLLARAEEVIE